MKLFTLLTCFYQYISLCSPFDIPSEYNYYHPRSNTTYHYTSVKQNGTKPTSQPNLRPTLAEERPVGSVIDIKTHDIQEDATECNNNNNIQIRPTLKSKEHYVTKRIKGKPNEVRKLQETGEIENGEQNRRNFVKININDDDDDAAKWTTYPFQVKDTELKEELYLKRKSYLSTKTPNISTRMHDFTTKEASFLTKNPDRPTKKPNIPTKKPNTSIKKPNWPTKKRISLSKKPIRLKKPKFPIKHIGFNISKPNIPNYLYNEFGLPGEEMNLPDEEVNFPDEEVNLPDDEVNLPDEDVNLLDEEVYLPDEEVNLPDEELTLPIPNTTLSTSSEIECGIDNSHEDLVKEGRANIETYPWLGVLYHRTAGKTHLTTPVTLITKQLVLAAALAIHSIPKYHFRRHARVILGQNCSHEGLGILEYSYHPEYRVSTHSSLALVQLNSTDVFRYWNELRPICGPPKLIEEITFHAMIVPHDCRRSRIEVVAMKYISSDKCTTFYRRNNLDISSMWPTSVICGQGETDGDCLWTDGTMLAVKQEGRWHLMGLGVRGPGCSAPSRFVEYTDYHRWVTKSVLRVGSPSITRIEENEVVIRNTVRLQRFGRCDLEEIQEELYTDSNIFKVRSTGRTHMARYNLTMELSLYEYTCVSITATYDLPYITKVHRPSMRVHAYCPTPLPMCHQVGISVMHFHVDVVFKWTTLFKIAVYGKPRQIVDDKSILRYTNEKKPLAVIPWDNW